ncbi:hypothetical protein C8J56DRAFT_891586 [Mycena floridula]|nr:hypothetical protein C8J56DRAFT_891586 [Mycena floridula]
MTGEVIMALLRVWLGTLASEPKAWGTMQASRNNPSLAGTFKAVSQAWLNPRKGYLSLGCHIAIRVQEVEVEVGLFRPLWNLYPTPTGTECGNLYLLRPPKSGGRVEVYLLKGKGLGGRGRGRAFQTFTSTPGEP